MSGGEVRSGPLAARYTSLQARQAVFRSDRGPGDGDMPTEYSWHGLRDEFDLLKHWSVVKPHKRLSISFQVTCAVMNMPVEGSSRRTPCSWRTISLLTGWQ